MKNLGALDSETKRWTHPNNACKDRNYTCMECEQKVIPRQGKIRKFHFAHYSKKECTYYEHPNESQIHKDAKYRLADILKRKLPVNIWWNCQNVDKCRGGGEVEVDIIYKDGDEVVVEYRDPNKVYVADVAIINNGNPRYIFEIKYKHLTITPRPEPWFEFDATDMFDHWTGNDDDDGNPIDYNTEKDEEFIFHCARRSNMKLCIGCVAFREVWMNRLPDIKFGHWPYPPCVVCNRTEYSAVWKGTYKTLCKICIETDYEDLKKRYGCMFI
jgi:hypothetical protein